MPTQGLTAPAEPETAMRSPARFWATAYTLFCLLTGTNLPTPLYRGYEREFGFSPLVVTLIFAVYVASLIPSLLIAGPLSDSVGRRTVLVPAVLLAALGSLAFALADDVGWLFAARLLQGLAVGAASGALTAALTELEPGGDRGRAALVSTVASVGGLGAGPLIAGLLAEYAPWPYALPYALEIVLLVPAAITMVTLPAPRPTTRRRPRRPTIPASMRGLFLSSGTASFLAFSVIGLFLSLVPAYVTKLSGSDNLALAGGAVTLMLACSVLAQIAAAGRRALGMQITGLVVLAAGLVLLAVAGGLSSLPLLLVATVVGGAGQGLAFLGALTEINRAAPQGRHADVLSSFYVVVYLGVGVPVIGVGLLATTTGLLPAVRLFAALVSALCLLTAAALFRGHMTGRGANGLP
ncbi:MFS transporter [Streptomyces achromogenes]|uniref:MFS transporter n=1 Tax=Streptomyces achromogenes TaxID=67255 RepID=UPI00371CA963